MIGERQMEPEGYGWREAALRRKWIENSGPLYEEREVVVTADFRRLIKWRSGSVSYASVWLVNQAEIGSTVTIKVRVK